MVGTDVNIYQILNGDCEHFDAFLSNWPEGRRGFAEQVFDALIQDSGLHPELSELFLSFKTSFMALACADDSVYCQAENPVRKFLSEALKRARVWYPVSGRSGRELPEKIQSFWESFADKPELLQSSFAEFLGKEEKRSLLSEQRLCESELGSIKQASAQIEVQNLLDSHLSGCLLSPSIGEFLRGVWRSELQFWRLNESQHSAEWALWSEALEVLGKVFKPSYECARSELMAKVQALFALLENPIRLNVCKQEEYQVFVSELNAALFSRLKNQFDTDQPLASIPPLAGSLHEGTSLSRALAAKARSLKVGDWFLFTDEDDHVLRCKLALKPEGTDQLLFVNAHGRKVMQKSVETFLLCLSTLVAKPLPQGPQFELSLTRVINLRREALALALRENVADTESSNSQSELEIKNTEPVGLATAVQLDLDPTDNEQAITSLVAGSEKHAGAEAAISRLRVGAWVEIKDAEPGESVRCKLAVIIRGADKYIFTDRLGTKVAEYHRDTLFAKFCHEQIAVHGQGENFEDQLAKVIRGLRKT